MAVGDQITPKPCVQIMYLPSRLSEGPDNCASCVSLKVRPIQVRLAPLCETTTSKQNLAQVKSTLSVSSCSLLTPRPSLNYSAGNDVSRLSTCDSKNCLEHYRILPIVKSRSQSGDKVPSGFTHSGWKTSIPVFARRPYLLRLPRQPRLRKHLRSSSSSQWPQHRRLTCSTRL